MTPETTTEEPFRAYAGAEAQQCLKLSRALFKARQERDLAQAAALELQARAEEDRKSIMEDVFQAQREAMRETSNETAFKGQLED